MAGNGGGGGSFVTKSPYNTTNSILVIAGGGGGYANANEASKGQITNTSGRSAEKSIVGANGNGGQNQGCIGGGGGFLTAELDSPSCRTGHSLMVQLVVLASMEWLVDSVAVVV